MRSPWLSGLRSQLLDRHNPTDTLGAKSHRFPISAAPGDKCRSFDLLRSTQAELQRRGWASSAVSPLGEASELPSLGWRQTSELASQVASLQQAGLPLVTGLRAAAIDLENRRLARAFDQLATQLDAGTSLGDVLRQFGPHLPRQARGLILAAVQSRQLPQTLTDWVDHSRRMRHLRWTVWASLFYPALLLLAVVCLVTLFAGVMAPTVLELQAETGFQLSSWGVDHDTAEMPLAQRLLHWLFLDGWKWLLGTLGLLFGVGVAIYLVRADWLYRLRGRLPLIGSLWRLAAWTQCTRLLAMLLQERLPLPVALSLTADTCEDAEIVRGCRRAAAEVERGAALDVAMTRAGGFPQSLIAWVEFGQRNHRLSETLHHAADVYEGRLRVRANLLRIALPPLVFLVVGACVLFLGYAILVPMLKLLNVLAQIA